MCLKNLFRPKPKPEPTNNTTTVIDFDKMTQEEAKPYATEIKNAVNKFRFEVDTRYNRYQGIVSKKERDLADMEDELNQKKAVYGMNTETINLYKKVKKFSQELNKYKASIEAFSSASALAMDIDSSVEILYNFESYKTIVKKIDPSIIEMVKGFDDMEDIIQMGQLLNMINDKISSRNVDLKLAADDINKRDEENISNYETIGQDDEMLKFFGVTQNDKGIVVDEPLTNGSNKSATNNAATSNSSSNANSNVNNSVDSARQTKNS